MPRPVLDDYDLVVTDCQPSFGLPTVSTLTAAHGVIVPLEAGYFAIRGVAPFVEWIERVQDRLNPRLELDGVLLATVGARTLHSCEVVKSACEDFGESIFATCISHTVKFPGASIATAPITEYTPSHPGTAAYRQLARELIARDRCA